jgi:hypothetical protein
MMPDSKRNVIVIACFSIAIVIIGSFFFLLPGFNPFADQTDTSQNLYAHLSLSVQNRATPHPLVQLSIDDNGDGIFEQVLTYAPTIVYKDGIFVQETPSTAVIKLNESVSHFQYRILVLDGASSMFNYTYEVPIGDGNVGRYNYITLPEDEECMVSTSYAVSRSEYFHR